MEHADTDGFEDPDDVPITEQTFHRIRESLRQLYVDAGVPREIRRRILEAAVRAPQDWHRGAIGAAYASDDEDIVEAVYEAMTIAAGFPEEEDDDDEFRD